MSIQHYHGARMTHQMVGFVRESNRIERIYRDPTEAELEAHVQFLRGPLSADALIHLVGIIQPGALPRYRRDMDVNVGNHLPPLGGPNIQVELETLLSIVSMTPFQRHVAYETLHPFTDGNGRSGRALWLRDMGGVGSAPLGFLHTFYYQTLDAVGG